jgi:hypothetical protein
MRGGLLGIGVKLVRRLKGVAADERADLMIRGGKHAV